jgi:hypothetical protein
LDSLAFPLVLAAACLAFSRWRYGLFLAALVAFLQDPLRKITPDQPVMFIMFAAGVFGAACIGAMSSGVSLMPNRIYGWKQNLGAPFTAFIVILFLQAFHSLAAYGNAMMSGIGLLSYLTPFPALAFTYQLAVREGPQIITGYYRVYLAFATVALFTVYLEFSGVQLPVFGEVGPGIIIYGASDIIKANSGTFRASEIAAWHSAAASCLFFLVTAGRKPDVRNILIAMVYIMFALAIGMLTGRAKMATVVTIFICCNFALTALFVRGALKMAIGGGLVGLIGYYIIGALMGPDAGELQGSAAYNEYMGRSQTTFSDAIDRFIGMGLSPIMWAYERFGIFGAGLGTGSQGSQYFGGGAGEFGGAGEGGLGKITMELGFPGLIIAAWFAAAFGRFIWHSVRQVARTSPQLAPLACSLLAFLIANIASFTVATQAFGDLFILLMLGITLGFLLALPSFAAQEALLRSRKIRG